MTEATPGAYDVARRAATPAVVGLAAASLLAAYAAGGLAAPAAAGLVAAWSCIVGMVAANGVILFEQLPYRLRRLAALQCLPHSARR